MNAKLEVVEPTPADALRDAAARLRHAREAVTEANRRIEGFDLAETQAREDTAQEALQEADEALQDALADGDEGAIEDARNRRKQATGAWNTARGAHDERKAAVKGLERRRDAAQAEQEAAVAAFTDAEVAFLQSELDRAEASYAAAAKKVRDTYCRTRALHFALRGKLGNGAPSIADATIRIPTLGPYSKKLRAHPEQYGPAFEDAHLNAHMEAAKEALKGDIEALAGKAG